MNAASASAAGVRSSEGVARKGRPLSRRAALSIRRLAILRGVRRVGAGGRSRKGTVRINQLKDLF